MSHESSGGPVTLTIDGIPVTVDEETTILQAARKIGIGIPAFCDDERLRPYGACRMCLVQVQGKKRIFPACTTPVGKDMKIITNSPEIQRLRQTSLELLLLHHPLDCPICEAAGECQLQDYAFTLGKSSNRFHAKRRDEPIDKRAPLIEIDNNRCILCGKCVRICDEVQGVHALDFAGRGIKTRITPSFGQPLSCEFCGQCVAVCPVGSLYPKVQKYKSRVWQLGFARSVCNYCGTGCTFDLRSKDKTVHRVWAPLGTGVNNGNLCGKGRFGFEFIHDSQRLKKPLVLSNGKLSETSWESALSYTAERLDEIQKQHGSESLAGLGSARSTNEDNYAFQKFMRTVLKTPHLDSCARFGHIPMENGMHLAFGSRSIPQTGARLADSDLVLVVESDITDFSPVFSLDILKAKLTRGAKIISANAKSSKIVQHSDLWLQVKAGTATALLNALCASLVPEAGAEIKKIKGFSAWAASLKNSSAAQCAADTGIVPEDFEQALALFKASQKPVIVLSMGIHENTKGLQTLLAAANLALLKNQGPSGVIVPAEFCNLAGMSAMGVRPDFGPGYTGPAHAGSSWLDWTTGSSIKALYVMGEDPLSVFPGRAATDRFLRSLDLLIVQDMFLTPTAQMAHVVLPACSFAEKSGTFTNSDLVTQKISPAFSPIGESKPDWEIVKLLSAKLRSPFSCESAEEITREISRVIPDFKPISSEEFVKNAVEKPAGSAGFSFQPAAMEAPDKVLSEKFPLLLFWGNLLQHSACLGTYNPGLLTDQGHSTLRLHPVDAEKFALTDGDRVKIVSPQGEAYSRILFDCKMRKGHGFTSAHFAEDRMNELMTASGNAKPCLAAVRLEKITHAV